MIGSCFSSLGKSEALTDHHDLGVRIRVNGGMYRMQIKSSVMTPNVPALEKFPFTFWYLSLPSHNPSVKVDFYACRLPKWPYPPSLKRCKRPC